LVVTMTEKKTWFITGAGRGMGVDFARTALAAGHAVVATGRNRDAYDELLSSLAREDATAVVV
jgi:NAD(P)-dependent dehydrogenase (short-subunit alcohol dehydrogenase family)